MDKVIITGNDLTLDEVVAVCRNYKKVELSDFAVERILKSRKVVDDFVENEDVVYGITTGFGKFSDVTISKEESKTLQKNLIISHSVGAGKPFDSEVVRGIILLRINNLAKGYSGARLETIQTMIEMLNRKVHPIIPEKGSLGASGDLAPLSHMVLPMIGLGQAEYEGEIMAGEEAMEKAGIPVIELTAKEGLALINGTQVMTALAALTVYDSLNIIKTADIAAALSFEAQNGIIDALDQRLHDIRPHKGQIDTARVLTELLTGSKMTTKQGEIRVQDAYSLRCVPQVHGASKDAINYVKEKIEIEINSVTDNPIIFPETNEGISGGNFHGQPMALSLDFLGIALSELANISERRIERLVNPTLSGLPAFLVEHGGLNSGFMIVQYSAAALVSENKILAHPASVDSIPSSANQEDHVSMGTIAARKAKEIMENVRRVLAMEIMCACQGIDLRGNKGLGAGTKPVYDEVRKVVPMLKEDRPIYDDINKCEELIKNGTITKACEGRIR
ncbi:MAG TPA: histidine ammonia-lyase [Sedimentibacter sp.]|jgi:histidine ammonia-lyase|nr:histidine ammonia-lyase [Sedimentibacter sp.]HOA20370.1 histidine ammonia-lyase [Sedimentibacter sp.]HOG61994.1 histidine ammonia-lyase [Sedimentibacter sp.]HPB80160.1 histidine ammonia-lyase [Sedimentibacter sp.]HPV84988.1 histidine ammonia-lyase [Sedimentibacter sp.]